MSPAVAPRAAGVRLPYPRLPEAVRGWAERTLGAPVIEARTQPGGMSPGCAARLRTATGAAAFLKAVGPELNPDTPALFRHEIAVQRVLPPVPYRPTVIASYDDGDWVGLLLEDVEGRHPDFAVPDLPAATNTHAPDTPTHAADRHAADRRAADAHAADPHAAGTHASDGTAVWRTVRQQARELTPAPAGLDITTLAESAQRWAERWQDIAADPGRYLPGWAAAQAGPLLRDHVQPLPARLAGASLCHWDLRNDNMLIRPGGQVVIFDWGMARIGPAWADEFLLSLEWAGTPRIDDYLAQITRDHGVPPRVLTSVLVSLAGSQAWRGAQPHQPGLPNLAGFAAGQAQLMFRVIQRRLAAG
jgi:hypothetical protein